MRNNEINGKFGLTTELLAHLEIKDVQYRTHQTIAMLENVSEEVKQ
jgi:hypothetical protein